MAAHGRNLSYSAGSVHGINMMAILAVVFAFVCAPLGIVFGSAAERQIRHTGEQGLGLAKAGLWLGAIFTVLGLLWFILVFAEASSRS